MYPRSFTKRIQLDSLFNRGTDSSNHWAGSSFKSFAVLRASSPHVQVTLVADPVNGVDKGIPLREGFFHNYEVKPNNAVFENFHVQSGEWVEVIFCTEDKLDSNPVQRKAESTTVSVGGVEGEMDGLTRLVRFSWVGFGEAGLNKMIDETSNKMNNGSFYNPHTDDLRYCFKVPKGFQAEILSAEFKISSALQAQPFEIFALPDRASFRDADLDDNFSDCWIGTLIDGGSFATPTEWTDMKSRPWIDKSSLYAMMGNTKGIARDGVIIDEGEIIAVGGKTFAILNGGTGGVNGTLLIRLKAKL